MRKAQVLLVCILLVIFLMPPQLTGATTISGRSPQTSKAARSAPKVSQIDLKSIKPLKEAFERDSGKVRLLTILSPT
jgi:hypothetical protein